jgi:quercetin dioxygenase-like cupin family protein
MEIKYNESTELRPEGERLMDAPLVTMDIPDFIKKIKKEPAWENKDRNAMTVYKTDGMRIVLIALHKDAELKRHVAEGIISVHVLDGKIEFTTDDSSVELEEGQILALHKGLYHQVKAIKESVFLLTIANATENKV